LGIVPDHNQTTLSRPLNKLIKTNEANKYGLLNHFDLKLVQSNVQVHAGTGRNNKLPTCRTM
jgi:hypothetical protein